MLVSARAIFIAAGHLALFWHPFVSNLSRVLYCIFSRVIMSYRLNDTPWPDAVEVLWSHLSCLYIFLPLACVILSLVLSHPVHPLCHFLSDSLASKSLARHCPLAAVTPASEYLSAFHGPFILLYSLPTSSCTLLTRHWPVPQTGGCSHQPWQLWPVSVAFAEVVCNEITMDKGNFQTPNVIVVSILLLLQETYFPCPSATLSRFPYITWVVLLHLLAFSQSLAKIIYSTTELSVKSWRGEHELLHAKLAPGLKANSTKRRWSGLHGVRLLERDFPGRDLSRWSVVWYIGSRMSFRNNLK